MGRLGVATTYALGSLVTASVCADQAPSTRARTPVTGELHVERISPAPGSVVTRETVVVADVIYAVRPFEGHKYSITGQVRTTTGSVSVRQIDAKAKAPTPPPLLTRARGRLRIRIPLGWGWDHPRIIRSPLAVRLYLHEEMPDYETSVVACTPYVNYEVK